jgi:hypothetical protein
MTNSCPRRRHSPPALVAAAVSLFLARPVARGDDSVAYKFENYREEDGRITVETQSSTVDQDLGPLTHLTLMGTIDAVSGATPTGAPAPPGSDQVVLTRIHERRKAWSGDLSRQVGNVNVDLGFADSHESDYVSAGWSVNTLTEFNQKNTTVRLGLAGTSDRVEVFFLPEYLPKHTAEAIFGVTQLIDPLTFVTVNVTLGRASGYLAEPHKLVQKSIEVFQGIYLQEDFAENRPNTRSRDTLFTSVNRAFPALRGALEGSYRLYTDTYGVTASTFTLSWLQHLGPSLVVGPTLRYFVQSAASFYYYNLDDTPIIPVRAPSGTGPYYSSDFRLSSMDDQAVGIKVAWKPKDWMQVDLAYEQYNMRGRDGVTPASAYPRAGITTAGARFLW